MNILHWLKRECSGLAFSTLEICEAEEKMGLSVCIKQPHEDMPIYGVDKDTQLHCVHSQINVRTYHDRIPKIMWMHGEPLSSVGNGVSMKAICDMAPLLDAFIAMREDEMPIWSSIKRTYLVPKGLDLEKYHPLPGITEKLSGEPAVLYAENWRGQRNPLYLCVAMEKVHRKFPNARLHLINCTDKKMKATFDALIKNNKWWPFIRTLGGAVDDINLMYNRCDILVSGLYPLYARGIEAFAAGKAFICPGYREHNYPFTCELHPDSIADAIIKCWENYDSVNYRGWAEKHHDIKDTVEQAVEVYRRYVA